MSTQQGVLYRTKCYLSGAMEFTEDGRSWRNKVKEELKDSGVVFYDPYDKPLLNAVPENSETIARLKKIRQDGRLEEVAEWMKSVRSDDLRLCDMTDFCISHISPSRAAWGTAEEIVTLNRMKKPIFLSIEGGRNLCPLWVLGMLKTKYIYNSVDDIIDVVKKINSGEILIDSERWRLLKYELR